VKNERWYFVIPQFMLKQSAKILNSQVNTQFFGAPE